MKGKTLETWERWFSDFNRCSTGMQKHLEKGGRRKGGGKQADRKRNVTYKVILFQTQTKCHGAVVSTAALYLVCPRIISHPGDQDF
jgi:hypothetical protein